MIVHYWKAHVGLRMLRGSPDLSPIAARVHRPDQRGQRGSKDLVSLDALLDYLIARELKGPQTCADVRHGTSFGMSPFA